MGLSVAFPLGAAVGSVKGISAGLRVGFITDDGRKEGGLCGNENADGGAEKNAGGGAEKAYVGAAVFAGAVGVVTGGCVVLAVGVAVCTAVGG